MSQRFASMRRSEGYTNARTFPAVAPLPESQSFAMVAPTTIATQNGTTNWRTVDLSQLLPDNAEYAVCYVWLSKTSSSNLDARIDVRRDDQVDSSIYTALRCFHNNGDPNVDDALFMVPLVMGSVRSFDFRVTGTVPSSATTTIEMRGYHTRTRNTADASTSVSDGGSGSGSGGSGGGREPAL